MATNNTVDSLDNFECTLLVGVVYYFMFLLLSALLFFVSQRRPSAFLVLWRRLSLVGYFPPLLLPPTSRGSSKIHSSMMT